MDYKEKFKDPRWQKLRLKVFERDNWKCQICNEKEVTLAVHHLVYKKESENPWDYAIDELTTLCEDCHKYEHENWKNTAELLIKTLKRRKFFADDLFNLSHGFHHAEYNDTSCQFANALDWAFYTTNLPKKIEDKYQKYIEKERGNKNGK